jgi:GGDEF domain-containing protein
VRAVERVQAELLGLRPLGPDAAPVTASFGVALLGAGDRDGTQLIERADAAMYEAKRAGGNRVTLAAPTCG